MRRPGPFFINHDGYTRFIIKMSTRTEILRTLAPFFDKYVVTVAQEQKGPAKRQEYLTNNVYSNPSACLESAAERFRKEANLSNKGRGSLAENLGLTGIDLEFLENITQEIGKRFTRCVHLLDTGKDAIDFARSWCNREETLRNIINEEIDLRRDLQKSRRQASEIIRETERDNKLTESLTEKLADRLTGSSFIDSLRKVIQEEVERAIEPLLVEDDESYSSGSDGGSGSGFSSYDDTDDEETGSGSDEGEEYEEESEEEEEDRRGRKRSSSPHPSKIASQKAHSERPEAKSSPASEKERPDSRAATSKSHAESRAVSKRTPTAPAPSEAPRSTARSTATSSQKLNIAGLNREEPVKEPVPQEWTGGKESRARTRKA